MQKVETKFKDPKIEVTGICPLCGGEIRHLIYKNGKESFVCDCDVIADEEKERERLANDKTSLITRNKAVCGFTKKDIEEVNNLRFITHEGNIEAYNKAVDYAKKFDNETNLGLYIHGSTGTGKSLIAKRVIAIVINKGYSAYITSVNKLMKDIKNDLSENRNDTLYRCLNVDLLVIDDIGTEKSRDFDKETIYNIIDGRVSDNKPIIFTSIVKPEALKYKYDSFEKTYSRIIGSSIIYEIKGKNFRLENK